MIFVLVILFLGLASPRSPVFSGFDFGLNPGAVNRDERTDGGGSYVIKKVEIPGIENFSLISDEQNFYYDDTGFLRVMFKLTPDPSLTPTEFLDFVSHNTFLKRMRADSYTRKFIIGRLGFSAGPRVHILDTVALADPLLSRLPAKNIDKFFIGHFWREVPSGYEETLKKGRNCIRDPELAKFYDKLSILTRGELFDTSRLIEVLKMNLGMYDHLAVYNKIPDLHKLPDGKLYDDQQKLLYPVE